MIVSHCSEVQTSVIVLENMLHKHYMNNLCKKNNKKILCFFFSIKNRLNNICDTFMPLGICLVFDGYKFCLILFQMGHPSCG